MTPFPYTEDTLVQQTTADYLEQQLGWESIYAHNREDFDGGGLLGRDSDREVVLARLLRSKLREVNPGLPDDAYDDAVRRITATAASQTIVAPIVRSTTCCATASRSPTATTGAGRPGGACACSTSTTSSARTSTAI